MTRPFDPQLVKKLSYSFARAHGVIAAQHVESGIETWVRHDVKPTALAEARRVLHQPLLPLLKTPDEFDRCLAQVYGSVDGHAASLIDDLEQEYDLQQLAQEMPQISDLLEAEDDAPIIRLINALLSQALREHASDIHIEAFETRSVVRFRVDGMLRDILQPQRALHAAIVSRIKVMAQLDIAEKRLPQDGRMALRLAGHAVDVRVSTLPTGHGERVVLRLLDKEAGRLSLSVLGMNPELRDSLEALIRQPHGIVLVTGPTGSGKTTSLYAALSGLDAGVMNIVTVEDPIEYDLDGVGQTQVNSKIDMSFAVALRAILRQDPDVIMVGEIRDLETAQIAVQASLTGHLVLATLHTNDAAAAVTRLVDMGVEPFLLSSGLLGVLAQRLIRKLCPHCKRAYTPDAAELATLPQAIKVLYAPVGCPSCNQTGYAGRTGIYELLTINDELRRLMHSGTDEAALRDAARAGGMRAMRDDGIRWVMAGETALEEVLRVTRES